MLAGPGPLCGHKCSSERFQCLSDRRNRTGNGGGEPLIPIVTAEEAVDVGVLVTPRHQQEVALPRLSLKNRKLGLCLDGFGHRQDEILAINDTRFRSLKSSMSGLQPGTRVKVLLARRGRIQTVEVALMASPASPTLAFDPDTKKKTEKLRNRWLGDR